MSRYDLYKFVHVLAAIVWVGAGATVQILVLRAKRGEPRRLHDLVGEATWLGNRVFLPASIVVLITGLAMIFDGPWSFSDLWISLGLTGFVITALNGAGILGPTGKKLSEAFGAGAADEPATRRLVSRLFTSMRVDLIVITAVVFIMVVKPGT